jgi:hypothetical protein
LFFGLFGLGVSALHSARANSRSDFQTLSYFIGISPSVRPLLYRHTKDESTTADINTLLLASGLSRAAACVDAFARAPSLAPITPVSTFPHHVDFDDAAR